MPKKVPTHHPSGYEAAKSQRERDRGTRTQRGYSNTWLRASKAYRVANPLCVECLKFERLTPATCVDHIIPHKGNHDLFWDVDGNWQSLCDTCHSKKSATEDGGFGRPVQHQRQRHVVCGAPGSGKSSYVAARSRSGDFVWDFDEISAGLFGTPLYDRPPEGVAIVQAMLEGAMRALEAGPFSAGVFIIVTNPTLATGFAARLKGELVFMEASQEECRARVTADGRGNRLPEVLAAIDQWFKLRECSAR